MVGRGLSARRVPCGQCSACRARVARDWSWRARAELVTSSAAAWCTLTYSDAFMPPTLEPARMRVLQREMRRLKPLRYFGSGEYGELKHRPHYHMIVYGWTPRELASALDELWPFGHYQVEDDVTPEAISYVAGYVQKKCVGWAGRQGRRELLDERTGELFVYRPPFRFVSRRPGLGSEFIRRFPDAWREHVLFRGQLVPSPRYAREVSRKRMTDAEVAEFDAYRDVASLDNGLRRWLDNPRHSAGVEALAASRDAQRYLTRRV